MIAVSDRKVPIAKLVPNPRNPRNHPDAQIERLMASLESDGQTKPVLARKENLMLIAGHGVTQAAKRLGWTDLAVRLLEVDQPTADRIMLADNRFSDLSSEDHDRVAELLRELDPADRLRTGYSDSEADKLLRDFDEHELRVEEVRTSEVADTFWIAVKGPLRLQADALQRLKGVMAELPDIEVRLGTVEVEPA